MKRLFLTVGILITYQLSNSQSNNPYNQTGIDYIASLAMIQNDYDAGLVREFNEETITHYSGAIPLQNQVSLSLVTNIINTRNSSTLNIDNIIDETQFSSFTKDAFKSIYKSAVKLSLTAYKDFLVNKVDEINSSAISQSEKELLLSFAAISYHTAQNPSLARRGCIITVDNESVAAEGVPCIVAGAVLGGIIGYQLCGFLCGLGGAIVGGVLGSLS